MRRLLGRHAVTLYVLFAIGLFAAGCAARSQSARSGLTLSAAEIDLWRAALEQLQRDHTSEVLVPFNKSLAVERDRVSYAYTSADQPTRALFDRLVDRNRVSVRLPTSVRMGRFKLNDLNRMRNSYGDFEWARLRIFSWRGPVWAVYLSLPALSDDGTRGGVYTLMRRGFDSGRGAGYVFEKSNGRWVLRNRFGVFIS